ncbi:hypothetical protein H257_14107 [Aphanomyces astaci]|uniref:Uncharacterized protein n=1 Tax=Aphanomyces astaci TaxID=112090 RepID=W4FSF5_APHAT|nr:hypothetical protein H257_14107 [Aphanomyces astaci]ETV70445.1 hypothetical protein H257_14107 [Aphanomyces astaci]|eukprot:XP_009840157.1 hypothetical protein H257_14107 [Aphanomyces astaci]
MCACFRNAFDGNAEEGSVVAVSLALYRSPRNVCTLVALKCCHQSSLEVLGDNVAKYSTEQLLLRSQLGPLSVIGIF